MRPRPRVCRSTKSTVYNHYLGGGFGRRLEPDMVESAVRIAKEVSTPVKVVWTREEDMQHDVYRPVYRDTISASLSNGKIVAWKYKVTGSSVLARWLPPAFQKGIDGDAVDSAVDMPYDIPNKRVEYVRAEPPGGARPASGAASDRTTMSSPSKVSWTSSRARRTWTRSPSASACSTARRG